MGTGKSKLRREAIIPLYDALREVLARIPKRSPIILTNIRRQPWKPNGFGTAFNRAKIGASMDPRDPHFHDLRGTAATRFYDAGLSKRVTAEIMASDEEYVTRIIRCYVGRSAATKAVIRYSIRPKRERKMQNRLPETELSGWSGRRESNPRMQLGKLPFYH
jgi:integrase